MRINALHAMVSLPEYHYQLSSELMRVLSEPDLDPLLRHEVLLALPFRSKYQVLEILRSSASPQVHRDLFERMRADPESRIRELAQSALEAI